MKRTDVFQKTLFEFFQNQNLTPVVADNLFKWKINLLRRALNGNNYLKARKNNEAIMGTWGSKNLARDWPSAKIWPDGMDLRLRYIKK